ncbi:hypothetical protein RHSIM_Rhsim07G0179300 [Rhododendron simsii]|uniref:Large ribosomal subunit protein mL45 n=1 Tax=Rhododendron simsii TaxID=118357 RepID=A0A834GPI4_RHOSS|nr:hypothetical protein RHSIM_Rhsim07G0179300 [Rhododendron simsii]
MAFGRLHTIRSLYRTAEVRQFSSLLGSLKSYSNVIVNVPETNFRGISSVSYECNHDLAWTSRKTKPLRCTMATELYVYMGDRRSVTTQAKAPPQARQTGSFKVSMTSPGIIYEPYAPREPIAFWRRWFTRSGWRRTKEDVLLELRSAYAITKLRKSGYSKQKFYNEALALYKEINTQIAAGDKTSLRKAVTENMYSGLKNEIKQRESRWSTLYWELVEPVVKIRTLRARMAIGTMLGCINFWFIVVGLLPCFWYLIIREKELAPRCSAAAAASWQCLMSLVAPFSTGIPGNASCRGVIGVDRNDVNKVFIQLTLEFLTKQKFEAYDSKGAIVAGDKNKEVLVRDIWVFEKSLFHTGAYWRLCGRIKP